MYCPRKTFLMLVGTLAVLIVIEIDAIPTPKSCLAYLKDMALEKFKAGLAQTSVVSEFRDAVGRIKEKYERAAEEGRFNITNEDEAAKFYYQIALEEVKLMKQTGSIAEKMSHVGDIEVPENYESVACKRGDFAGDEEADYDMMDMDMEDTGADRLELENELDRLNHELESEMGWSMSPEAKANMHKQARKLASEVLQNEVKDLALAAVTGFMTGGVGGAVGPVWTVVSAGLKLKVFRYFVQMLLDILSSYLGQPITLEGHSSPEMDLKGTPQINAAIPVAA